MTCQVASAPTSAPVEALDAPGALGTAAVSAVASAELAAVSSILGKLPTPEEYLEWAGKLAGDRDDTYRYLNFDQLEEYNDEFVA